MNWCLSSCSSKWSLVCIDIAILCMCVCVNRFIQFSTPFPPSHDYKHFKLSHLYRKITTVFLIDAILSLQKHNDEEAFHLSYRLHNGCWVEATRSNKSVSVCVCIIYPSSDFNLTQTKNHYHIFRVRTHIHTFHCIDRCVMVLRTFIKCLSESYQIHWEIYVVIIHNMIIKVIICQKERISTKW